MTASFVWLLVLAVVQGLTEFLPVSSSSHLAILHHLEPSGSHEANFAFDILLHVATLVAVLVYFRADLYGIALGVVRPASRHENATGLSPVSTVIAIAVATAGTGAVFAAFKLFHVATKETTTDLSRIGVGLVVTGILLWSFNLKRLNERPARSLTLPIAFAVGIVQGLALLPGISRSGSTIAAGFLLGLDRLVAARFSFYVAIPAILAAAVLDCRPLFEGGDGAPLALGPAVAAAALVAGVVGYIAIGLIFRLMRSLRFHAFAYYCWAVGAITLAVGLFA